MPYITMTAEETAIYDFGHDRAVRALMAELRERAEAARKGGEPVEIYTADGILAEVVQ